MVILYLVSDMNFGSEAYGTLDLGNLDDQLVVIAKRLADRLDDGSVHLFSNDTRPMRKAVGLGLKLMAIPEEWRRADEQTDEDREKLRLADENKRLRSQEPMGHQQGQTDQGGRFRQGWAQHHQVRQSQAAHTSPMVTSGNKRGVQISRDRIDTMIRTALRDGTSDGSLRADLDPKLASLVILGAVNWVGIWFRETGDQKPADIAREVVRESLKGYLSTA